jgi:hypothetical protein
MKRKSDGRSALLLNNDKGLTTRQALMRKSNQILYKISKEKHIIGAGCFYLL